MALCRTGDQAPSISPNCSISTSGSSGAKSKSITGPGRSCRVSSASVQSLDMLFHVTSSMVVSGTGVVIRDVRRSSKERRRGFDGSEGLGRGRAWG